MSDFAHILPFARFRNGLALCKIHHWLFNKGLISIDPNSRATVPKAIESHDSDSPASKDREQDAPLPERPHKVATRR